MELGHEIDFKAIWALFSLPKIVSTSDYLQIWRSKIMIDSRNLLVLIIGLVVSSSSLSAERYFFPKNTLQKICSFSFSGKQKSRTITYLFDHASKFEFADSKYLLSKLQKSSKLFRFQESKDGLRFVVKDPQDIHHYAHVQASYLVKRMENLINDYIYSFSRDANEKFWPEISFELKTPTKRFPLDNLSFTYGKEQKTYYPNKGRKVESIEDIKAIFSILEMGGEPISDVQLKINIKNPKLRTWLANELAKDLDSYEVNKSNKGKINEFLREEIEYLKNLQNLS